MFTKFFIITKAYYHVHESLISTSESLISICSVSIFRQYSVNYVHTVRGKTCDRIREDCLTVTEYKLMTSKLRNSLFRQTFFSEIYINITPQKTTSNLPNIFCELDSKARKIFQILIETFRLCLSSSEMLRSLSW
jgi:hypothetical protein